MIERIGRYRVLRRVGAGAMAEVFLASVRGEEGFEKRVAIKRVHDDRTLDPTHLQIFADEARLVAQLDHPNIVQVFSFERHDDVPFLVMEYVDGLSLSRALQLASAAHLLPSPAAIADAGAQVCDALAYAHGARSYDDQPLRIVHRDIKPANLLLTPAGQIKVADFGVARASTNLHRTRTGAGKGTLTYMAPEQIDGGPIGPTADLYALGVVLFEMATGTALFAAEGLTEFLDRKKAGWRDEERALLLDRAPELEPIVARALRAEPAERFPEAAAMGESLRALAPGNGRERLAAWIAGLGHEVHADDGAERTATWDSLPPAAVGAASSTPAPTVVRPPRETAGAASSRPRRWPWGPLALATAVLVGGALLIAQPWTRGTRGAFGPANGSGAATAPTDPPGDAAAAADGAGDAATATGQVPPGEATAPPHGAGRTPADVASSTPAADDPPPGDAAAARAPPTGEDGRAAGESPEPDGADVPGADDGSAIPAVAAEGRGRLSITTKPWCTIHVDGVVRGEQGAVVNLELPLGSHAIRLVPMGGSAPEHETSLTLTSDGESQQWRFEFRDGTWIARTKAGDG